MPAPVASRFLPGLALLSAFVSRTAVGQEGIDPALAREYFEEARQADLVEGGRLWGRRILGPMLLVDRATRAIAANQPDSAGLLTESGGIWVGRLPESHPIVNAAVTWGGRRWAMVGWPLPSDRYARLRLMFHEQFHRIQPEVLPIGSDPQNAHLATAHGRIWTRLEWRALAEALIRQGNERRLAVRDALAFRAIRHSAMPTAAAEEQALLLNEGLAEYTGWRSSGLPDQVLADRIAVELIRNESQETLSRSFAYAAGPALGILLDEARVPWRRGLNAGSDLYAQLAEAFGLAPADTADARVRAPRYGSQRLIAEETRAEERRVAVERRNRARFIEGPTLTLSVGDKFSFSFDPYGAVPLPGAGTVYQSSQISDGWGTLRVEGGGVLMRRAPEGRITGVVVAAPAGASAPPMQGEGWRLELAAGWVIRPGGRPGDWVVAPAP